MDTLFPLTVGADDLPDISGLSYIPNCISEKEELRLVKSIDRLPWDTRWRRRIQPYGGLYGTRGDAPPIPAWGKRLAERLLADGITDVCFDQMLVNEYLPGQGIAAHLDYQPYGRTIVSLSLLSPYVMDFYHTSIEGRRSLLLEPRSLVVLSDEARYQWKHGIAPRKSDIWQGISFQRGRRLSVTFRFLNSSK